MAPGPEGRASSVICWSAQEMRSSGCIVKTGRSCSRPSGICSGTDGFTSKAPQQDRQDRDCFSAIPVATFWLPRPASVSGNRSERRSALVDRRLRGPWSSNRAEIRRGVQPGSDGRGLPTRGRCHCPRRADNDASLGLQRRNLRVTRRCGPIRPPCPVEAGRDNGEKPEIATAGPGRGPVVIRTGGDEPGDASRVSS